MKKLFGGIRMTWPRVIVFAVCAAVLTAGLNLIPGLQDTSFSDLAVNLEGWFLFAMIVIMNCRTWKEAALKCFVFFLISQPLIYLIEVPFLPLGWGLFQYYRYWAVLTVLTLPGAAIAFRVKKGDWLSAAILSVATVYLAVQGVTYVRSAIDRFPRHLLSALFCFALAVVFILCLLRTPKRKAAALAIFAAAAILYAVVTGAAPTASSGLLLDEGTWSCTPADDGIVEVTITDGNRAAIRGKKNGATELLFTDENGQIVEYQVVVDGKNLQISLID